MDRLLLRTVWCCDWVIWCSYHSFCHILVRSHCFQHWLVSSGELLFSSREQRAILVHTVLVKTMDLQLLRGRSLDFFEWLCHSWSCYTRLQPTWINVEKSMSGVGIAWMSPSLRTMENEVIQRGVHRNNSCCWPSFPPVQYCKSLWSTFKSYTFHHRGSLILELLCEHWSLCVVGKTLRGVSEWDGNSILISNVDFIEPGFFVAPCCM